MLYDALKNMLGAASISNLPDASRLQRQAELIEEIETELEDLESQLAEWESVCGFWGEGAA